jgi:PAS domain S-box-containing protein
MPVPVSLTACPVFGRAGRAPAAVVLVRDVTEQRLAQAILAEVEERLREAERLSQTGSWLWDRRTGSVQWSDGLHRIHGRDPLEFDGTFDGHLDSVHPADREALRAAVAEAVASGHPLEQEYRVALTEDGARWVHTRAEPTIGSDGTVVGLRGIAQDVTGERRDAPS